MKNIFNKTNAPYLVSGALAIGTLLASGIFAVAPYIGFLAPVAALSLGLPFIVGGAVFSAAAIALSAVVISKNNTISEKGTEISNLKDKLTKVEKVIEAKNKAIANLNEDDILKRQERREKKQEEVLDCTDLRNLSKGEKQKKEVLGPVVHRNLFDESPSSENQPTKSEGKGIFYDAEPSEEKSTKNHSTQNSQSWTEWGIDTAKVALRGTIFATVAATPIVSVFLTKPEVSGVLHEINGTYSRC